MGEGRKKSRNCSERRGEGNEREHKDRGENRDSDPPRHKSRRHGFFLKKSRPAAVIKEEEAQGGGEQVEEGEIACERNAGLQRES